MHTPGPWIADKERRGSVQIFNGYVGFMVAEVPVTPDNIEERSVQLILAAPDLLEALQSVISEWREGYGLRCVEQVRAAIAKAIHEPAERIREDRRDA